MAIITISVTVLLALLVGNKANAKPLYYSCPAIGYGTNLVYGGTYHRDWRIFYPGTAESASFEYYTHSSVSKQTCNSCQEFNCYFRFKNNIDGLQAQTGLDGMLTRKLPSHRTCTVVGKRTVKCL